MTYRLGEEVLRNDKQQVTMSPVPLIVAAAAMVDRDGRVLVQRRPDDKAHGGLWEFPGGKVDQGETPENALIRELEEELAIGVPCGCLSPAAFASTPLDDRHLILLLFVVRKWTGVPRALAASELRWVRPPDLYALEMPPADGPLIPLLEVVL